MSGFGIAGKIGVVTGGGNGIGRAIAQTLIAEGAQVVVFDLDPGNSPVGTALALSVDVANEQAVFAAFAQIDEAMGPIDFLVNNAGIDAETVPSKDWLAAPLDRTIDVNLKGAFHCMRHAVAHMRRKEGGSIVNIGSVAAVVGVPTRPAYAASKHGLVGLTRTAGVQFGPENIRTNIVCPGGVNTDLMARVMADNPILTEQVVATCPLGRLAQPSEIADAVLWLVSPRSSYVNGAIIAVDGGYTAA